MNPENLFICEHRYIVFKIKDANNYLTKRERDTLEKLSAKCSLGRIEDEKRILDCVVIESDWPEFEPTWTAIEARMARRSQMKPPKIIFLQWHGSGDMQDSRPNEVTWAENKVFAHDIEYIRAPQGFDDFLSSARSLCNLWNSPSCPLTEANVKFKELTQAIDRLDAAGKETK